MDIDDLMNDIFFNCMLPASPLIPLPSGRGKSEKPQLVLGFSFFIILTDDEDYDIDYTVETLEEEGGGTMKRRSKGDPRRVPYEWRREPKRNRSATGLVTIDFGLYHRSHLIEELRDMGVIVYTLSARQYGALEGSRKFFAEWRAKDISEALLSVI